MASTAEVDLVIDTSDTLVTLEQELTEIVRAAEASTDAVEISALLDTDASLEELIDDLNTVVTLAEAAGDTIAVDAALDSLAALEELRDDLDDVITQAEQLANDIEIDAALDANEAALEAELAALVEELEAGAPEVDLEVDVDRQGGGRRAIAGIGRILSSVAGPAAGAAAGIGKVGLAAGAAAPLLAATATSLASIAPAAALAVSGMVAVQLVSGTLKLAMQGVGDAISTAFDPEAKPEELAKAMEKLSPNAREFVIELRSMRGELKTIQQEVQENFFANFAEGLEGLGNTVLPVVRNALRVTSTTLSEMANSAADAGIKLAQNGTLGRALSSANVGLFNLRNTSGQVVTGLGQIAAAAGPSFERVTAAAARSATNISDKLTKAFESGALEEAISTAVDTLAQLGRIAGNVFEGLGNIIQGVTVEGNGLFTSLEKITQAFADVTATNGFQQALKALSQTAAVLVDTVLPLITQALQSLGPVFQALAAPVQILVRALGAGLSKILTALEPVLVSLGNAFGQLVLAVAPLINLAASLIAAILPVLTPLFDALGQALNEITPFIEELSKILISALVPIFTKLATEVLPQILPPFIELQTKIFPLLTDALIKLTPSLITLATAFADLLVELTPVIVELVNLSIAFVDELMPVIQPIIDLMTQLTTGALTGLSSIIKEVVVPALRILVDLLQGDFREAWEGAKDLIKNVGEEIEEVIRETAENIVKDLTNLARRVGEKALEIARNLVDRLRKGGDDVVTDFQELPDRVVRGLGDLGQRLVSAGRDFVQGFIDGITSKLGRLQEVAQEMADTAARAAKSFLGISSPSKLMMEVGNDTMDGFILGIGDKIPDLRRELQVVASMVPSFALPGGQQLRLPQLGRQQPSVQVFIGNEELNTHVDSRITENNMSRDRLIVRGVRP